MRVSVNALGSAKLAIDNALFTDVVCKLQSERSAALYDLYLMGMISSPSVIVLPDFRKALSQQSADDFKFLISRDGKLLMTQEMMGYAILMAKDEDFKKALSLYKCYDFVSSQLTSLKTKVQDSLANGLAKVTFGGVGVVKGISAKIGITDKFIYNNGYMSCVALRDCVVRRPKTRIIDIDLRGEYLKGLAEVVGVPAKEILNRASSNQSIFIKGLTFEEEKTVAEALSRGDIVPNGDFADLLNKAIIEARNSEQAQALHFASDTVRQNTFYKALSLRFQTMENARKEFERFNPRVIWVSEQFVTLEVEQGFFPKPDVIIDYRPRMQTGYFLYDNHAKQSLSKENLISGICGELVSEETVKSQGYYTEGFPVTINSSRLVRYSGNWAVSTTESKYYYLQDVYYSDERNNNGELISKNIIPVVGEYDKKTGIHLEISDLTFDDIFKCYKVDSISGLVEVFLSKKLNLTFNYFDLISEEEYKKLVVKCLINYIICEVNSERSDFVDIDLNKYSPDVIRYACCEAESNFTVIWRREWSKRK